MKTFELPSPLVPATAFPDGLLPVAALDKPLEVDIVIWEHMQTGYFVQLILNGRLVGERRAKTEQEHPGDVMTLELAIEHLEHDGTYALAYRATNDKSLQHTDAPSVQIKVDRAAPGATLLAPLMFLGINFGDVLTAHVPGYADMAEGDTVQTLCNGTQGPAHRVSHDDLNTRPMQIDFSREFLQGLNSAEIEFTYHVTDRAGNQSRLARPARLTAKFENIPTLT